MNLYVLLAIALSAVTGTAEAPAARPAFARVVAQSGVRATRAVEAPSHTLPRAKNDEPARPGVVAAPPRVEIPLTGASSPRAPASSC